MKCYIPIHSGFCFGVDLAVKAAYKNLDTSTYMYGDIVHNPSVIADLRSKGLGLVDSLDDIPNGKDINVLIRAHGVSESIITEVKNRGYGIIDKTCPRVKKVHEIVADASCRGLDIIIIGTPNHPEVLGIAGWAKTQTVVLRDLSDAQKIIPNTSFSEKGICIIAQTTHNKERFEQVYKYCSSVLPHIEHYDTICDATAIRQEEIRRLSLTVNCVIVIGGKTSSNVTRLYEIASEYNNNTHHIESANEFDVSALKGVDSVLLASGASTPESSIAEVVKCIENYCLKNKLSFELLKP